MKEKKKKINYAHSFATVLFVASLVNLGFYWLPDSLFGFKLKKVDLLSDIRNLPPRENDLLALLADDEDEFSISKDTLSHSDASPLSSTPDSIAVSNPVQESKTSQATQVKTSETTSNNTDYLTNKNIEDFTAGNNGLQHFFAALNNINDLGRPVRVAFLGDSFIEGDIFVADFRAKMQQQFGGRGVGFIPIQSEVAKYRPTIKQSADGWKTFSIIKDKSKQYILSGLVFEPRSEQASYHFETTTMYPGLEEVSTLKFLYTSNENTELLLKSNADTSSYSLPPTSIVTQIEINGNFTKGTMQFKNTAGLNALGVAFEDNRGVVVDNFSLRGNSGIVMSMLDKNNCRTLQEIRPYDLIILQYGLNVASDSVRDYGWYRNQMITVVEHVQDCFPGADLMILGISDRCQNYGGDYTTMPAVMSLLRAQRQTAVNSKITFWSIFAAMGGVNSMVRYVNNNWASKDYTHLSFRGGREIANALFDALLIEKDRYNNKEADDEDD
jgi:hypothetical protein